MFKTTTVAAISLLFDGSGGSSLVRVDAGDHHGPMDYTYVHRGIWVERVAGATGTHTISDLQSLCVDYNVVLHTGKSCKSKALGYTDVAHH